MYSHSLGFFAYDSWILFKQTSTCVCQVRLSLELPHNRWWALKSPINMKGGGSCCKREVSDCSSRTLLGGTYILQIVRVWAASCTVGCELETICNEYNMAVLCYCLQCSCTVGRKEFFVGIFLSGVFDRILFHAQPHRLRHHIEQHRRWTAWRWSLGTKTTEMNHFSLLVDVQIFTIIICTFCFCTELTQN